MTKSKTIEQLRAEKERAETQLLQEQHKLERLENRKKYLEKGERTKRTHRLCNLGGTIESLAPEVKDLTRTEMTELMEHIFSLSEVQRAVRHMAITHIDTLILPPCLVPSYRHRPMMNSHRAFFIYRRILNEQYRNQHRHLPDCQKADRQDHLYRPCPFQPDRKRDDGGQNQASAP